MSPEGDVQTSCDDLQCQVDALGVALYTYVMDDLPPGTVLGNYRLRRVAGRGAVGIVYEAEHMVLGRTVAVKMLNPAHADQTVFRARFSREGRGAASVQHPNIVTVFDAGEHEGSPYLVMDFIDGPDLEQVLVGRGGRLPKEAAVGIGRAVADALDAAAAQGFAHRDVKPANILMGALMPPNVYLTDFGLIKSSAEVSVTQTGSFVGTLLYMSPEQIQGKAVPASDQYSLACVMWECLTGRAPYQIEGDEPLSLLTAHLHRDIPAISQSQGMPASAELDGVFRRALAKDPVERFPTSGAFMDALAAALDTPDTTAVFPVLDPTPPLPSGDEIVDDLGGPATAPTEERQRPVAAPPVAAPGGPPGGPIVSPPVATFTADGDHMPPPVPHSPSPSGQASRGGLVVLVVAAVIVAGVLAALAIRSISGQAGDPIASTAEGVSEEGQTSAVSPSAGEVPGVPLDATSVSVQGRVAFVGDGDIWISHVDGTAAVNLTAGAYSNPAQPAWRPGFPELVFSSEVGLQLVDLSDGDDAATVTALTDDSRHTDPSWSSGGERLIFSIAVGEDRDLAILELGGEPEPIGVVEELQDGGGRVVAQRPTWSPDGQLVVFQLTDDEGPALWSVAVDGTGPAPLDALPDGSSFHPEFLHGPQPVILYTNIPPGEEAMQLLRLDLDSGAVQRVETASGVSVGNADFSPCGDVIVSDVREADGPTGLAFYPIGGGDPFDGLVPKPDGVIDTSDPSWQGQSCP